MPRSFQRPSSAVRKRRQDRIRDFQEPRPPSSAFKRRKRDLDDGGVTVDPTKPKNLSGGAAAALEFDD